jgi:hypothetical protein
MGRPLGELAVATSTLDGGSELLELSSHQLVQPLMAKLVLHDQKKKKSI